MMKSAFACAAAMVALSLSATAQHATFCGGQIVADSVYDTTMSNGRTAVVTYYGQFRNTTSKPLSMVIRFAAAGAKPELHMMTSMSPVEAKAYSSQTIKLATQTFQNPSGAGRLSNDDKKHAIAVQCIAR